MTEITAASPQTEDAERVGFECFECGKPRVFLQSTLIGMVEREVAAATRRRKRVELDISLLP